MNGLIILLGIILLGGVLFHENKKNRQPRLITKSILSLLFVVTALLHARLFYWSFEVMRETLIFQ